MNRFDFKKLSYLILVLIFGFLGAKCATPQKEVKTYPLTEINLEKVFQENRGLKVLRENATMIHDNYRGGVQEKEEGEKWLKEGNWEEARSHLEESNRFLRIVVKYLPDDEASRNVYGDVMVIFLPNLLLADNDLKLITVYKKLGNDNKIAEANSDGLNCLAQSLKSVKTEWAYQVEKGLKDESAKK
jgi:hypothetical protein